MQYINRHIESTVQEYAKSFPIVLITGARQVGKSTLLANVFEDLEYITFDDPTQVVSAKSDPKHFFSLITPPVIFAEIQYIGELFSYLKMEVDRRKAKGLYIMTGSQQYSLMQNVTESLAGRVGILVLHGLSLREEYGDTFSEPFVPSREQIMHRTVQHSIERDELWKIIHRGSYPELVKEAVSKDMYYGSYVKTYIERDVRSLTQIGDEWQFTIFLTVLASRTGSIVNYTDIAKEVGVSSPTIKRWISILIAGGIVTLLYPWSRNIEKQVTKTPKLYFLDTGLASWLTKWHTPQSLEEGSMAGAFFETFVISEIIKSWHNAGREPSLYFYRDHEGKEIDLLIEDGQILYPVEIKKSATPGSSALKNFGVLRNINTEIGPKTVICSIDKPVFLSKDAVALPVSYI
jgi:predicted AAA+ superfamily ATPase